MMPNTWIFVAIFALVPLVLFLRGRGIVGMSFSVACLYGVSVAIFILTQILPPKPLGWLLDLLAPSDALHNRIYHDTYYVIAYYEAAIAPAVLYGLIALVFWALYRWQAPVSKRVTTSLFWVLHLIVLTLACYSLWFEGNRMPRRYIDYDDTLGSYLFFIGVAETLIYLTLAGLVLTAIWSIVQRLRTRAL